MAWWMMSPHELLLLLLLSLKSASSSRTPVVVAAKLRYKVNGCCPRGRLLALIASVAVPRFSIGPDSCGPERPLVYIWKVLLSVRLYLFRRLPKQQNTQLRGHVAWPCTWLAPAGERFTEIQTLHIYYWSKSGKHDEQSPWCSTRGLYWTKGVNSHSYQLPPAYMNSQCRLMQGLRSSSVPSSGHAYGRS